jgi:hypothetical protein
MLQLPVGRTVQSAHVQAPQETYDQIVWVPSNKQPYAAGRCAIPNHLLPVSPLSPVIFTPIPAYRRPLTAFGVPLPPCLLQIDTPPEEFRIPNFLRLGAAAFLPFSVSVQPSPSTRVPVLVPSVSHPRSRPLTAFGVALSPLLLAPDHDYKPSSDKDTECHLLDSLFHGTAAVLIPPALCPP